METDNTRADRATVAEVEEDRARERAYQLGYDDAKAGVRRHYHSFIGGAEFNAYDDGYSAARAAIIEGDITVDEIVEAAKAVHIELPKSDGLGWRRYRPRHYSSGAVTSNDNVPAQLSTSLPRPTPVSMPLLPGVETCPSDAGVQAGSPLAAVFSTPPVVETPPPATRSLLRATFTSHRFLITLGGLTAVVGALLAVFELWA